MKFTLGWLKEHLDTSADLNQITQTLTSIGLEVEQVHDPSENLSDFVIGKVEEAQKHPDADRLKICKVNTGSKTVQVVCGAPNAVTGLKGVFAPPGSYVPGTDMVLKKGNIRGVDSEGMLLSEREIGLSDEHEGIIELASDAPVGQSYVSYTGMDDPVIEIGLTPNRADCACVRGIARDLAAAGIGALKDLEVPKVEAEFDSPVSVELKFENPEQEKACPVFLGRAIKGVENRPSPEWMQQRLKAVGLRPISALVDITNYLTLALNRPLHVFDMNKLKGNIHVTLSKGGETLSALNDKEYTLARGQTVICDDSGVIALGGVIGGESTSVDENTQDVFLEVAYFDPARTARTGRDLGIISDARYRFERGIDPEFINAGAEIATQMILDLCGGQASDIIKAGEIPAKLAPVDYNPERFACLTGLEADLKTQAEILESLGFEVIQKSGSHWQVNVPSWRTDILGQADLVEEVARICGYDQIPTTSVKRQESLTTTPHETRNMTLARQSRSALAARGYNEAITWSFTSSHKALLFEVNDNQSGQNEQKRQSLKLVNPISSDLDQMRPSPLCNLIEAAGRNADRGFPDSALFESGPGFYNSSPQGQKLITAGVRAEKTGPRHWRGEQNPRNIDFYDVKADFLAVLEACGFDGSKAPLTRETPEYYHPGQSAVMKLGPNILGYMGMIHPATLEELDIDLPVAAFEVFVENIPVPKSKGPGRPVHKASDFQPVRRDFAFIVDSAASADQLIRAAMGADKKLIEDVRVFDVYTGKGVEEGQKSIALEVTLQPKERTLTEQDLETISRKLIDIVEKKAGGKLRA